MCSPSSGAQARDPVRVAVGRQRSDATPTTGTLYLGGGREKLEVPVRCEPVAREAQ
ncbi:hypothetical protein [Corallococcus caeni]|uniref:hypothetical protein n=1 Tax=Corallococcus caeni TaxID=3082388 RepID=UPI0030C723C8